MRKMVYRNANGTVVNTWTDADAGAKVELVNILPPDEVEAKRKYDAEKPARKERYKKLREEKERS